MLLVPDGYESGEERWRAYGHVGNFAFIMTAHIYRLEMGIERIRIISARRATKYERKNYERENG
jgi:uncharacterized protein